MSHRPLPATLGLALMLASPFAIAQSTDSQTGDAHGIQVRAACAQAVPAPRLLLDLSCESAMDCWSDPASLDVLDVDTGERVEASGRDLVYVDANGALQAEPPMQGTIRAVWTAVLGAPLAAKRLQLVQNDETATAAFAPAAECAAVPAAAVKRLAGG
ncbi:hypothetical protein [Lysobacter auxotrophicus]|uniref:Uncharacterized protein n=1 Tax=Lysobacter auxotrophicus TaxID=2992573 RepID=A0ABM8DHG6_9GAMM|nr:hypothetical protein [Lysobacter auxotrophicus]BDU18038.1 hypothetical protein LA521A_32390 [Lysobacter auxotrophicus]